VWDCNQCAWVKSLSYADEGFFSHSIKLRGLLEIPLWKVCRNTSFSLRLSSGFSASTKQARNQGSNFPPPPGKMCWTSFKTIGHSSKNVGPSQNTLRPSWCPKLVTGLVLSTKLYLLWRVFIIHLLSFYACVIF